MHVSLRTALLLLAAPFVLLGAESRITRVWPEYRSAESFDRIGEYFGGEEKHPGRIIRRSQAGERAGTYFLIRLSSREGLGAARTWQLQVLYPGTDKARSFSFPFSPEAREKVTELGLTGADWPDPKTSPVAWRVALVDASGRELLSAQSFLWR